MAGESEGLTGGYLNLKGNRGGSEPRAERRVKERPLLALKEINTIGVRRRVRCGKGKKKPERAEPFRRGREACESRGVKGAWQANHERLNDSTGSRNRIILNESLGSGGSWAGRGRGSTKVGVGAWFTLKKKRDRRIWLLQDELLATKGDERTDASCSLERGIPESDCRPTRCAAETHVGGVPIRAVRTSGRASKKRLSDSGIGR